MRTLYKLITECHTQTNNRDTNQREHYINILQNTTQTQFVCVWHSVICLYNVLSDWYHGYLFVCGIR
jgi:hypothetical protein